MQFTTLALSLLVVAGAVVAAPVERRDSGRGTYFYQGGNAGACGNVNSDNAMIVAVNSAQYSQGLCGKQITVHHGGKSINAVIADECPSCGNGDLDLSVGAFESLANLDLGEIEISWSM